MEAVIAGERLECVDAAAPRPAEIESALELRRVRDERDLLASQVSELRSSLRTAVEDERHRIRRDLHDGAQHLFLAAGIQLRTLAPLIDADPVTAKARVNQTVTTLIDAMADLRRLVTGDAPSLLATHGLAGAIDALASKAAFPVEVLEAPSRVLSEQTEANVYFTVSELLSNVTKHACASKAEVRITEHSSSVIVEVLDDGRGGVDVANGSGLRGLCGRASSVDVVSVIGGGTLVRASVTKD